VAEAGVVRGRQSVRVPPGPKPGTSKLKPPRFFILSGRVAAGAIAEKYLRQAYGVEIIAFVSSVGKIHIPHVQIPKPSTSRFASNGVPVGSSAGSEEDENDDEDEQLSEGFIHLLDKVTREEVDQSQVRCPHKETAEKMIKVTIRIWFLFIFVTGVA
jgi:chorismate synthase